MEPDNNAPWVGRVGLRMIIVVALIAIVTPFWVFLVFFTDLPLIVLALIALVILLLLSTATAWTAVAFPHIDPDDEQRRPDDRPNDPDR